MHVSHIKTCVQHTHTHIHTGERRKEKREGREREERENAGRIIKQRQKNQKEFLRRPKKMEIKTQHTKINRIE